MENTPSASRIVEVRCPSRMEIQPSSNQRFSCCLAGAGAPWPDRASQSMAIDSGSSISPSPRTALSQPAASSPGCGLPAPGPGVPIARRRWTGPSGVSTRRGSSAIRGPVARKRGRGRVTRVRPISPRRAWVRSGMTGSGGRTGPRPGTRPPGIQRSGPSGGRDSRDHLGAGSRRGRSGERPGSGPAASGSGGSRVPPGPDPLGEWRRDVVATAGPAGSMWRVPGWRHRPELAMPTWRCVVPV